MVIDHCSLAYIVTSRPIHWTGIISSTIALFEDIFDGLITFIQCRSLGLGDETFNSCLPEFGGTLHCRCHLGMFYGIRLSTGLIRVSQGSWHSCTICQGLATGTGCVLDVVAG